MDFISPFFLKISSLGDGVLAFFSTSLSQGEQYQAENISFASHLESLGLDQDKIAYGRQVHGSFVRVVTSAGNQGTCDSLVTSRKDLFLAVFVADCGSILLADERNRVIANIHAGWKGTLEKIAGKTVAVMRKEFGSRAREIKAFISPSIGPCCYEVGEEVASLFPDGSVRERNGKLFLDLWSTIQKDLESQGIASGNMAISGSCTFCNPRLFHSYRRNGVKSGRMVSLIGMEPSTSGP